METLRVLQRVRIEDLPEDTAWPKHQIIDGSLIVTPWAGTTHQAVVGDVHFALRSAAPDGVAVYPGTNVRHRRADGEADLLIPDVVIARSGAGDGTHLDPSEVLLVVEVVAPSTRTTDTVTKRATYDAWGIPLYLVVDPESRDLTWHGDSSTVLWAVESVTGAIGS